MDKSKFLFFLGSLIWVCLACTLSSIGPEYIHYYFTDVCEFLDRSGKSGNKKKETITIANINKNVNHRSENKIPSNEEYHLFVFFNILNKYIDLDKYQKILHPPCESIHSSFMNRNNKLLIDRQESISPLIGNCLPFQALQIITTSIIRS